MKRLIAFVSLFAMGSLAACSPIGDGTRDSCVGPYTGTFEGDSTEDGPVEGRILANFAPPNLMTNVPEFEFSLTFDNETSSDVPDQRVVLDVTETGDVAERSGFFAFTGTFDFDDCEVSGTWSGGAIYSNGTWRLTTGHSAY